MTKPHTDEEIDALLVGVRGALDLRNLSAAECKFCLAAPSLVRQLRQRNKELEDERIASLPSVYYGAQRMKEAMLNRLAQAAARKWGCAARLTGADVMRGVREIEAELKSVTLDGEAEKQSVK